MASSSSTMEISSTILPYQFEPTQDSSDSSNEEREDIFVAENTETTQSLSRAGQPASSWCKCGNCQESNLSIECICCQELEETNKLMSEVSEGLKESLTLHWVLTPHFALLICCFCCCRFYANWIVLVLLLDCIIKLPGFSSCCLDRDVLWMGICRLADTEGTYLPPSTNVPLK